MHDHLVRIGILGQIGRFQSVDGVIFQRGGSVICRTGRGLEFGAVLNSVHNENADLPQVGTILRGATPEDHLLWARIEKNRTEAFGACMLLLKQRSVDAVLMDVELLFDGSSIFFYFLGDITPDVAALTTELADAYEAKIQLRQFAEAMALGCGPDCGTKDGGCSVGGCSTCSVANSCGTSQVAK